MVQDDIDLSLKTKKLISEFEDKNLKDWIFGWKTRCLKK